ncbi:serine threonine-protein kinase [Castilleja foliolosa]|uniref:Serine threonine-protein kinase n=1 Tax=Castilleja foliolosa TaxID=1961234 RepID=A0ABD3DSL8_9LAMI
MLLVLDWGEDGIATSADSAALWASFSQEVAVWHKLDHPNVTKFVGASMGTSNHKIPSQGTLDGDHNSLPSRACCVVVEYIPGGTLKKFLIRNSRKKLAFKVVVQLALDLARGLSYLHSKKIVHRDVKTENMLLQTDKTLKIADFGVARIEAQNPRDVTGNTGTLGYMAPEVLDGKPYNRKCDVYSFGISLWEIYCCDVHYSDLSFAEVSCAVVQQFVGASIGTSNLKIPSQGTLDGDHNSLPSRACCVVVEYIPGGTLKKFLIRNSRKKLAFKVVVQLALDLARGLSYLHSKKIVHRDVKTENMLLQTDRTLKIADFGVARIEAQNPRDMTGNTGTLGYMAPEVLDGKPYNRKCDVYSFGICLWEIYCCDMPYSDLSFAEVSCAIVQQVLRPEIPRCCPGGFTSIMRKCWAAKPENRPEMDEVVKLLEGVDTSKGGGMIPDDQTLKCLCFGSVRGP